jgi:hypothetical protein
MAIGAAVLTEKRQGSLFQLIRQIVSLEKRSLKGSANPFRLALWTIGNVKIGAFAVLTANSLENVHWVRIVFPFLP